jgi:hypothetical protein
MFALATFCPPPRSFCEARWSWRATVSYLRESEVARTLGAGGAPWGRITRVILACRLASEILELMVAGLMQRGGDDGALKDVLVQFHESASLNYLRDGRLATIVDELCAK